MATYRLIVAAAAICGTIETANTALGSKRGCEHNGTQENGNSVVSNEPQIQELVALYARDQQLPVPAIPTLSSMTASN